MWLIAGVAGAAAAAGAGGLYLANDNASAPAMLGDTGRACAQDKASLANVDKEIADLEKTRLPADTARQLIDVIDQLIAGLKTVNGAADQVIGPVNDAKDKLDDIEKKLKTAGGVTPPGWSRLKGALGGLADGIAKGAKRYEDSPAGKGVDKVASAQKLIKPTIEKLETVKTGLEGVLAYDKAANGSGQEQIEALKYAFDRMKGALAVDEVPGLGPLLDAYSEALGGMAKSVGGIETATKEKLKNADEALAAGGSPLGETNISDLYPGMKTNRDKTADRLAALKALKARLEGQIAANKCDEPPPPKDPCTDPNGDMDPIRRLMEKATAKEQHEYDTRQKAYADAFLALSQHNLNQPQRGSSPGELEIDSLTGQLSGLKQAAASNDMSAFGSPSQARAAAVALAGRIGADAKALPFDDRLAIQTLIGRMQPALDARAAKAHEDGEAAYQAAAKGWQTRYDDLLALAKDAQRQRDNARDALKKKAGDFLVNETKAKGWASDKLNQFDACFPPLGELRKASLPPPPPPPAPPPPAAPPPKPPEPEPQPTGVEHKCVKQGGINGAVNDVACRIGGGQ